MFYEEITKSVVPDRVYQVPEGVRVYAIGDIHGHLNLLEDLHAQIKQDIKESKAQEIVVVYLGDYIDRGTESKAVVDYLLQTILEVNRTVYLRGNHEQRLLDAVEDAETLPDWMRVGGDAALLSYGVEIYGKTNVEIAQGLKEKLPQTHLDFITNTQLSHVEGDYLFVHAGINPKASFDVENMEAQKEDVLRIRKEFLSSDKAFDYKIVFGHSIFKEVTDFGNKLAVDTGAFATGKLSCAVLEGDQVRCLSTR